jgi:hypothetical protein
MNCSQPSFYFMTSSIWLSELYHHFAALRLGCDYGGAEGDYGDEGGEIDKSGGSGL